MSFGLATWGPDGTLQMDPTSFTIRVVLSVLVNFPASPSAARASQDFSVLGLNPSNGTAIVIPVGNASGTQFETEVLNDAVRVYNWNRGFPAGTWVASVGTMRLLVIRFS